MRRLVYTSSGAAYGYHPDNPALLLEDDPLRGNEAFAYAHHKRLVEQMLAEARAGHPELEQVIFRVSTVLGEGIDNQITALFERPVVLGLRGAASPFCFVRAVHDGPPGVYNLAGDGVMTLREIAGAMRGRYLALPPRLVERALGFASARGWGPYGPEQVRFLLHRPVLGNERLRRDFGWSPPHSSREAFAVYRRSRRADGARR